MGSPNELPKNKPELLERIHAAWDKLQRVYISANELALERSFRPESWSAKDHLAHLAAWERWLVQFHIQGQPAHVVLQLPQNELDFSDGDQINAIIQERSEKKRVAEILLELIDSHTQVLSTLEGIDFQDLMKPHYADDPEARPLLLWVIGNTYEHYQEHAQTIHELLQN